MDGRQHPAGRGGVDRGEDLNRASAPVHQPVQESMFDFSDSLSPTPEFVTTGNENRSQAIVTSNSVKNTHTNSPIIEIKNTDKPPRRVTEIRVFYDDQTWESFVPAKK